MPMTVMVTGAGGFIGSHLVEDQLARGREVVAVDIHEGHLKEITGQPRLRFHQVDVVDIKKLAPLLQGVDIVFHLASAHLEVGLGEERYEEVNVKAIRALLEAARDAGVSRFVHCSSVGVFGDCKANPANEDSPCFPTNLYERTKLQGEREALKFFRETGFPVVVARPAWVFGPRCPRTKKLISNISKGHFLMIGRCQNYRHPIYIADMIRAFDLLAHQPRAEGQVFIIAAETPIKIKDFVRTICEVTGSPYPRVRIPMWTGRLLAAAVEKSFAVVGKEPPFSRRTLAFFENNNAFDISKARTLLNFKPKYTLKSGLEETLKLGDKSRLNVPEELACAG